MGDMDPFIVSAAIRNKANQTQIVCGPRHGNCLNFVNRYQTVFPEPKSENWEMGFVDQDGKFYTRQEAWKIADKNGQIARPLGFEKDRKSIRPAGIGDDGMLFSENLY